MALLLASAACTQAPADDHVAALSELWLRTTSAYQAEVLEDSRVSDDEYVEAVNDTASCVNALGFETGPVQDVPDGVRKNFVVIEGDGTEAEGDAAWHECSAEHLVAVESVYLAQHARPEVGDATLERELLDCLAINGLSDARTGMTDYQLFDLLRSSEASSAAWVCREHWLLARGELGATPSD